MKTQINCHHVFVKIIVIFIFIFMPLHAFAETDEDMEDISLSDLLNIENTVASKTAATPRESPGIVTVITKEEIQNSGARNLFEILRTRQKEQIMSVELIIPGLRH